MSIGIVHTIGQPEPDGTLEEIAAEMETEAERKHPLLRDEHGTVRFKSNRLVRFLITNCLFDLNHIWRLAADGLFDEEELREVYRQMGYSVNGYWEVFPDRRNHAAE